MRRLPTSQHEDRLQAALPKAGDQGLHPDADLGGALTPVAAGGGGVWDSHWTTLSPPRGFLPSLSSASLRLRFSWFKIRCPPPP